MKKSIGAVCRAPIARCAGTTRVKYRLFRREQRPRDGKRGLVMLQLDALAYVELRRAIELGYCPDDLEDGARRRLHAAPLVLRPALGDAVLPGRNLLRHERGIPAFRFYDKAERRVITCNTPSGVQYIRDRIDAPGRARRRIELREPARRRRTDGRVHRRDAREDVRLSPPRRLADGAC